ncbi:protein phosphatase regulatory subunit Sds22 [Elasticomyces elasticus]|nr:protein phosphatase regulatory subunit Sds22 [Elasticomyces elasticus]
MADDTETTTTAPTATATATPANDPATPKKDSKTSSVHSTPLSKSGWDGKLRIEKKAVLVNSEILSDPDYSDEDAPPVDRIDADEDLLDDEDPDVEASILFIRTFHG